MPDGNQIVANAADGTQHVFPAGTDMAVVDKTMRVYAATKNSPTSQPTQFEKDRPSTGWDTSGADSKFNWQGTGDAAMNTIKNMFTPDTSRQGIIKRMGDPVGVVSGIPDAIKNAAGEAQSGWQRGRQESPSNLWAGPGQALLSGLAGLLGYSAKSSAEHAARGEGGPIVGEAIPPVAMAAAAPLVEEAGPMVKKAGALVPKMDAVQNMLGVGEGMTKDAVTARDAKVSKATAKYQDKVSDVQRANEQAKEDFQQRQQLTDEAQGHAKELAQHLPELAEQERAFAKALYPEIEGTLAPKELMGKIQDAIDSNIRGTDKVPTALKKVMDAVTPEDPLAQASVFRGGGSASRGIGPRGVSLDELPPAVREKVMKTLPPEERAMYEAPEPSGVNGLTFDKLHGMYSELGAELGKDLPGDERAAVAQGRATLLDSMRKMAESENKLSQFQAAQKNWSQYENTFNKTWSDKRGVASPIAKALQAKDPVTGEMLPDRVQSILSKDANYTLGQKLLSRYKGAKTDILQLMKEKGDQAAGLPKSLKQTRLPSEPPPLPEVDARQLKADALRKKADMLGGFSGRGMFIDTASLLHFLTTGNPAALSIPIGRRIAAKAIRVGAEGPLTGLSEAETKILKPSQVYSSPKAAAKGGFKGGINAQGAEESLKPVSGQRTIDSLSNEITTMKEKLRNAGNAPMAEKKALQKQIEDYQSRLDDMRKERN